MSDMWLYKIYQISEFSQDAQYPLLITGATEDYEFVAITRFEGKMFAVMRTKS